MFSPPVHAPCQPAFGGTSEFVGRGRSHPLELHTEVPRTGTGVLAADHTQQAVPMFTECAPYTRMHTHVELKHAPVCSLPALLGHLTAPRQAGRRAWGHRE